MNTTRKLVSILDNSFGNADIESSVLVPQGYDVSLHEALTEEEVIVAGKGACAFILAASRVGSKVLDALPECRVVSRYGVGVDTIDVEAATAHGVAVMNVPDYCMDEVAEHAIALMFALSRGIAFHDRELRHGGWSTDKVGVRTLVGRTLGLLGFGRIGKAVAWRAQGLGMQLIAYDLAPAPLPGVRVEFAASLEEMLPQVDVLTLHVPLTRETRGMIGARQLALMKRDAILVNTARGAVVNENDLVEALRQGRLAGAAADAHVNEPLPKDSPLFTLPNFVMTPHMAYYSPESQVRMRLLGAQNIVDFFNGAGHSHRVNSV